MKMVGTNSEKVSGFMTPKTTDKDLPKLIGKSDSILKIKELIKKISKSEGNVLITGETGTGKEVVAQLIHRLGNRSSQPMIAVNCAAIPEALFESELFGHEKGAFTGALQRRRGMFELASGGILLLDDVDDMPLQIQAKLLRALQERKVTRVGGESTINIDARVISTTKRLLRKNIKGGKFREDLYFRLNTLPIHISPLCERSQDIMLLANYFLGIFAKGRNKNLYFSKEVIWLLNNYEWPGNVRELENLVERMISLATTDKIPHTYLPKFLRQRLPADKAKIDLTLIDLNQKLWEVELQYLRWAMTVSSGNQTRAAELLGLTRTTLRSKMLKFNLSKNEF